LFNDVQAFVDALLQFSL